MTAKDTRTKRQKLIDMANQTDSPLEAEIAKGKLEAMKPEEEFIPTIKVMTFEFTMNMTSMGTWSNVFTTSYHTSTKK